MKRFADLTEQEVLALAITNEEEDSRIYRGFAEGLRANYAATAKMFDAGRSKVWDQRLNPDLPSINSAAMRTISPDRRTFPSRR